MSENKITDYKLLERIGSGTYAIVHRAMHKTTQEILAVKVIPMSKVSNSFVDNIISEISLLKKLKHRHIVEMRDFLWDDENIYILMEYCNAGNLSSYIKQNRTLDEGTCRQFLQQLALALRYMRQNDVSHLDLKPANLLLMKHSGIYILKVGDFGFAQRLKPYQENTAVKGSPLYMAPEILLKTPYGPEADLWSVGVILYESLFGKAPYSSKNMHELAERIRRNDPITIPVQPAITAECRQLLTGLLQRDPAHRITFEKFFDDPFLDLEHMACEENLAKGIALINLAIEKDQRQELVAAYRAYCQGLKYFVPITRVEADPAKRKLLRERVLTYLNRAETLMRHIYAINRTVERQQPKALVNVKPPNTKLPTNSGTQPGTSKGAGGPEQPNTAPEPDLMELARDYEDIARGLQIGCEADKDASEDRLDVALDGYTAALGLLIPMLHKVTPVEQRKLLRQRIKHWMEEAEHIKSIRSAQIMQEMERTGANHYGCIVQ
ncbi:serine/threonine-protein kinase ULK3 [Anopheles maculipalpis]|uniref:serine/threonine-protein kinase ULK3 n=1 Tax=Anopheles maculipalpis TaxID=1496333 RepID=UPI00215920CA|nr:serine/threonine-protein kinase ULK3 [Anopheles maculipalpis]